MSDIVIGILAGIGLWVVCTYILRPLFSCCVFATVMTLLWCLAVDPKKITPSIIWCPFRVWLSEFWDYACWPCTEVNFGNWRYPLWRLHRNTSE